MKGCPIWGASVHDEAMGCHERGGRRDADGPTSLWRALMAWGVILFVLLPLSAFGAE